MKGFVPTPEPVVNLMVEKLLRDRPPTGDSTLLDPGCGQGPFIDGVMRWCRRNHSPLPSIVGIESDPEHFAVASERFRGVDRVEIRHADFLHPSDERFDYIIGNPPYVPITALTTTERDGYRRAYTTAKGRFDLYLLFYEQALRLLKPDGRLVFITPEKFLYVETARPLRELLSRRHVEELHFLDEQTFGHLITYPLVATIAGSARSRPTRVVPRSRGATSVRFGVLGSDSWMCAIMGVERQSSELTLGDICVRVSCGVATGADGVFVVRNDKLDPQLWSFAHRTIAGRQITPGKPLEPRHVMLVPYDENGQLVPESELGHLGRYLSLADRRAKLLERTCVQRKPWYAFHENPPMRDVRRPKLLCKDITPAPFFVPEPEGDMIPRHSVYYVVPTDPACLDELGEYLNSPSAQQWLRSHCQRAANGYLRLQSHVLKRLPLPSSFGRLRTVSSRALQLEAQLA